MLDTFNRANGAIGSNWTGQNDSSFTVSSNQLAINSSGLDSFAAWSPASFGADQEAYVTLSQISASGLEQGLLLKTAADTSAALKVVYVAPAHVVRVFIFTSAQGWAQRGADISVTMNNGDQLGARAKANGDVEVYRNGSLLGTVSITAWTPYSGGGYIGLWYSNASGAIVDDFGGGNVSASATATPTNTSTPTSTNTSTITRTPTVTTSPAGTMTPSRTLTPANTLTPSRTPTIMLTPSLTPTLTNTPTFTSTPTSTPPPSGPVTINYVYDPLYRLTEANYSNGDYYHYAYDAVGNRLSQTTQLAVSSYQYDVANRLNFVNGVSYTWDNNGNLLNDGVNTYVYDSANRLIALSNQQSASRYQYNGLGDRLTQSVSGDTTTYALDINTSLPEVLSDGQFTYLYGLDNIAQVNSGGTQYFLGDALNSTRQLTDANGQITLAQSYDPFGSVTFSAGNGQSVYGYTSEQSDLSGLVYLRARYYSPNDGRFTSRDAWGGIYSQPLTLNRWNYVHSNPIMFTDPSGHIELSEAQEAFEIVHELKNKYQVSIIPDWGNFEKDTNRLIGLLPVTPAFLELSGYGCSLWHTGTWSLEELRIVKAAVMNLDKAMKHRFANYIKAVTIQKVWYTCGRGCTKSGNLIELLNSNRLPPKSSSNNFLAESIKKSQSKMNFDQWTIVHELGHVWDQNNNWNLSKRLEATTGGDTMPHDPSATNDCTIYDPHHELPGCNTAGYWYGGIPPVTSGIGFDRRQDFAESVAAYVFPTEAWHEVQKQLEFYKANARDVYSLYYAHLYYDDFRATPRGIFIENQIGK